MKKLLIPLLVLLGAGIISCQPAEKKKKNVLFIMTDDLNCNLSAYGHYLVKTPNIDRLAAEGMLFENAFTNFPLCGPSRASLLMGLYPDQSKHKGNDMLIRDHVPEVITLPQTFMNNGYETARVGKIFHYMNPRDIGNPGHDDSLSWNERIYPRGRDKTEEDQIFSLKPGRLGAILSWMAAEGTDEEQTDGMVATESIKLLEKYAKEDTPFFLAVGFYKPHTPYVAPKKYFEQYPVERIRIPEVPEGYLATLPAPAQRTLTGKKEQNNLSDSLARRAIQAYYATISFMDAQVGRVLDALDKQGLKDNTIIVFLSDHGYHMGEHGYYQKMTLFEDSDRIPLIISNPGNRNGARRSRSIVEMIDLYPTLAELADIPAPAYVAGKSIKSILEDPEAVVRESALTQMPNGYTLRTPDYRYTRWKAGGPGMTELYDRRNDPAEMDNLAKDPAYAGQIAELDKKLSQRVEAASRPPEGLVVK